MKPVGTQPATPPPAAGRLETGRAQASRADGPGRGPEPRGFVIGVMKATVEGRDEDFDAVVDAAVAGLEDRLTHGRLGLSVRLFEFPGPHLSPAAGAYSPLDFLQLGLAEKVERGLHFLLIVTEVDLAATTQSYVLALPSALTNVGIVSTKRLHPRFWGQPDEREAATRRLTAIMLHTLGHLLGLSHSTDPANVMYAPREVEDLDRGAHFTEEQVARMRQNLPIEARERVGEHRLWWFVFARILANMPSIGRAVARASPFHLALRLPTMITAALSLVIVLFFTAEIWDVASTVEVYQLAILAVVSVGAATVVLYRAFALAGVSARSRTLAESTVVTATATAVSLLLTMLLLYAVFAGLVYLGAVTVFPKKLMETWPTVDPATLLLDHIKLAMFIGAMGVLAGSLGGRAESRDVIRHILFIDEET